MSYAESAYFDGNYCAHCAARDEFNRLAAIAKQCARIARELGERRRGSRAIAA